MNALDVVAAEAEGHLGQVVGAEREELGLLGDLVGGQAARGTSIMVPIRYSTLTPAFFISVSAIAIARFLRIVSSSITSDQGDHDLGQDRFAPLLDFDRRA